MFQHYRVSSIFQVNTIKFSASISLILNSEATNCLAECNFHFESLLLQACQTRNIQIPGWKKERHAKNDCDINIKFLMLAWMIYDPKLSPYEISRMSSV